MFKQSVYGSPLSSGYWRSALDDFKQVRVLTFAAMMIAACVGLSYIPSIRMNIGGVDLRLTWGFLARSICGMVGGPITALVFGLAEDTISFFMNPSGPYFPGYALTTMLGTMIYALFLYRARPTILRVFLAKLFTNVLNVVLGSLWSAILSGKGYLYIMTKSALKNGLLWPLQAVMLVVLMQALAKPLQQMRLLPKYDAK